MRDRVKEWAMIRLQSHRWDGHVVDAIIEPGAVCNLRCPFCSTGNGSLNLSSTFLTKGRFKSILDKLGPQLRTVYLFNWGESLLNRDLEEMVAESSSRGLTTILHANLSLPTFNQERAERIVKAGLTRLTVSCDGASQESYERYRVNGDFDLVIRNIRLLQEAKRRLRVEHPEIRWKFLVHAGNQHELKSARAMAAELGIPIDFQDLEFPEQVHGSALRQTERASMPPASRGKIEASPVLCLGAWTQPVIHSDGMVLPCCIVADPEFSLGNIFEESLQEMWNKPLISDMRLYLSRGIKSDRKLPCYGCSHDPNRV